MRHAPNFVPGTAFSYSNTHYVLAGMIIGRGTGHGWEREVHTTPRTRRVRHQHDRRPRPLLLGAGRAAIRFGLGLAWLPLSCGGGVFGHAGDTDGCHTRIAATPDGRRVAVVSATGDGDPNTGRNSEHAMDSLVDRRLCGR